MRKSPIRHRVRSHKRQGTFVHSFWRGKGQSDVSRTKRKVIREKGTLQTCAKCGRKFFSKRDVILCNKCFYDGWEYVDEGWRINKQRRDYLKNFRKDIRYDLRFYALNIYGKNIAELSYHELKTVLTEVFKKSKPFYVKSVGIIPFKEFFRDVFKNELTKVRKLK